MSVQMYCKCGITWSIFYSKISCLYFPYCTVFKYKNNYCTLNSLPLHLTLSHPPISFIPSSVLWQERSGLAASPVLFWLDLTLQLVSSCIFCSYSLTSSKLSPVGKARNNSTHTQTHTEHHVRNISPSIWKNLDWDNIPDSPCHSSNQATACLWPTRRMSRMFWNNRRTIVEGQ